MSEWWSYRPSDFLMFSPRIYWRLFASLNLMAWPAQPLIVGAALAWLWRHGRQAETLGPAAARLALGGMAMAWLAVAWLFFQQRYAPINWAAGYATATFLLQAAGLLALAWLGGVQGRSDAVRRHFGLALLVWALLAHPLLAWAGGRPWLQAEVFGLAPDPTAIGTLGLLLLLRAQRPAAHVALLALWPLPWLWCLISAATLWTMGSPQAAVLAAAAALSLVALVRR